MYNFVENVKLAQVKLYMLYCVPYTRFDDLAFDEFNITDTLTNKNLPRVGFLTLMEVRMQCTWVFSFVGHKYLVYQDELSTARELQPMTKNAFKVIMANMNQQCEGAMVGLIKELERHFPKHQIMTTLGVVYPQLWSRNPK